MSASLFGMELLPRLMARPRATEPPSACPACDSPAARRLLGQLVARAVFANRNTVTAGDILGVQTGRMVDIKVTLLDGAYHEVDSSELAFKIAGSMAFKKAAALANPVLLEPVMSVEVTTPEDYMGEVIGDLNSRRGQIQAMEERTGARVVKALVPLSEMFGYVGDLRSKTQGRANYSMQFDSYSEVPPNIAKEIIAKARGE